MERTLLKTLIVALVAGPLAGVAVAAYGRAPAPSFEPLAVKSVRTITIPASARERTLHAEPGLRLSRLDADGCGVVARAVRQADGSMRTVQEPFCRH